MIESEYDGQYVEYVSASGLVHTGYVIGKTEGEPARYFVHSDHVAADREAFWHFTMTREMLLATLTDAPEAV